MGWLSSERSYEPAIRNNGEEANPLPTAPYGNTVISALGVLSRVRQRMFHGEFVQDIVECAFGRLIVCRPPTNLLEEGAPVTLSFSPEHTVLLQG